MTFNMLFSMSFGAVAVAASCSSFNTITSSSTSTTFDSGVPTSVAVSGDYTGALRPQIHFSPPKQFMNDPNGCFLDANGTWHLYYQCKFRVSRLLLMMLALVRPVLDLLDNSFKKCHASLGADMVKIIQPMS